MTRADTARSRSPNRRRDAHISSPFRNATPRSWTGPSRPAAAVAMPRPGEWMTWSYDQKLAYMKTTFMEEERKLFTSWLPVRFQIFECRPCHGSAAVRDGSFRMPNPDLPIVAPGPEGFKELSEHEPEALRFMQSRLVPTTARLLGLPEFDFKTHKGFSCYQCHVRGQ